MNFIYFAVLPGFSFIRMSHQANPLDNAAGRRWLAKGGVNKWLFQLLHYMHTMYLKRSFPLL
jgi:hypothetical protein